MRYLELQELTLNYEKKKQKLQSFILEKGSRIKLCPKQYKTSM